MPHVVRLCIMNQMCLATVAVSVSITGQFVHMLAKHAVSYSSSNH